MRTALDTNILSGLWSGNPGSDVVSERLAAAQQEGSLVVCGVVFAELMANPHVTQSFAVEYVARRSIAVDFNLGQDVWKLTGERFRHYAMRRRSSGGGEPKRLLADFVVGAHAVLYADRLMTLDVARYERDFPELTLVVPGQSA